ncbi:MAG TPA: hypothetical protein VFB96_21275 [Pirellulaceae bacterium]|nr:hypothetical protein [Pirellulaceae bacterium]
MYETTDQSILRVCPPLLRLAAVVFALLLLTEARAHAQAAWEFSPYQVQVWLALEDRPELGGGFAQRMSGILVGRSEVVFGSVWRLDAATAPAAVAADALLRLESVTPDSIGAAAPSALDRDKLFVVAARITGGAYRVAVREIDGRTRQAGPIIERTAGQREAIPLVAWDAIVESFTPLAKVESVAEKQVQLRVRAGGLVTDSASPAMIQPGQVLKPVIRRNDKSGQPTKNGIQPLDWTLLSVQDRSDALIVCNLHSGFRTPIPVRGGARTERLAFLAKPRHGSTRIVLTARSDPQRRLSGYEVFVKGQGKDETFLLGVTDWDGAVEIDRSDVNFRMLYVRNGGQLLARLPMSPGFERELVAKTIEDDSRLQAEGFVLALQGRTMDLVAQREILVIQIRARIKEKKFDTARQLLEQFRTLDTRDDLIRDLDAQQQAVNSDDALTRQRIAKLFGDARNMLQDKHLDPELISVLQRELAAAAPATAASGN